MTLAQAAAKKTMILGEGGGNKLKYINKGLSPGKGGWYMYGTKGYGLLVSKVLSSQEQGSVLKKIQINFSQTG